MKGKIEINGWTLSVINDGYGKEKGLYEIGLWKDKSDVADTVKVEGWLTLDEVLKYIEQIIIDPLKVYVSLSN
jgi:hypothetical protein